MNETDALLLESWMHERNADAFKTLARRYAGMVFGTCKRILNNPTEAEDAAQECFELLATTQKPVGEYLAPWLHRAACNKALTRLRSERRRMERETQFAADQETAKEVDWNDIYGVVDEAIAELPDKWRVPVVAHFLDDQTHAAIAQTLGIPRRTVTDRIDQGVEQLRKVLTSRGVAVSAVALAGLITANAAEAAPATLITSLGKLALSGTTLVSGAATVTAAAKTAAGFWTTKTILAAVASLMMTLGAAAGYWTLHDMKPFGRVTAPLVSLQQAAKNTQGQGSGTGTGGPHAGVPGMAEAVAEVFPAQEELGTISGRVYNVATGRGIPFTTVTAQGASGKIEVNTSLDGGYEINGLVPGGYGLSASAPFGFVNPDNGPEKTAILMRGGRLDHIDLERAMGVSLSGFVRDQSGRPVLGARVKALQPRGSSSEALSEKDGSFKLTDLYPNQDKLRISAESDSMPALAENSYSLGTEDMKGVEIVLEPGARISGRLVDGAGHSVVGMDINAWSNRPQNLYSPTFTTNDNGEFDLRPLAGGTYDICVSPLGSNTSINHDLDRVDLEPGEELAGLVLVYDTTIGMRVAGRVTDPAGKPLFCKHVACLGPVLSTTITNEDGRFENTRLPAGYYKLSVEGRTMKEHFIPDGKDLEIVLDSPVKVQCHIADKVTGKAVSRFQASAFFRVTSAPSPMNSYGNMRDVYDADGRYWMDLEPGDYRICVRAAGYRAALKDITVESESALAVEIALEPVPTLEVRVLNERGAPVADAGIHLFSPEETRNAIKWGHSFSPGGEPLGKTGGDGIFRTDALTPDNGVVHVSHPDYAPSSAPLRLGTPVTIKLQPGGLVQGIVEVEGEARPESFQVVLSYSGTPEVECGYMQADQSGRFRFDHVRPGPATVRASADWYRPDGAYNSCRQEVAQEVMVGQTEAENLVLHIPTGACTMTGGVYLDGMPFGDFNVEVRVTAHDGRETVHSVHTRFDGGFALENVPAGEARISIKQFQWDGCGFTTTRTMPILPGQDNHAEFAFTQRDLQ